MRCDGRAGNNKKRFKCQNQGPHQNITEGVIFTFSFEIYEREFTNDHVQFNRMNLLSTSQISLIALST